MAAEWVSFRNSRSASERLSDSPPARSLVERRRCRVDLMIAATAAANDLPLFTRNARDFAGLEQAVTIVPA
jgi:predicted nucleic acid-binding protein